MAIDFPCFKEIKKHKNKRKNLKNNLIIDYKE